MITVTKQDNGVLFTFENSDKYLYGSGTIEVPFNSLSIIQDESDMITLRKAASNDIFLVARYDTDFGYGSKEEAVEALKGMLFAETGGGSGSGVTPSEVQEMIDESVSGKADTAVVNQAISEATAAILSVSGDVQTNSENIAAIWDTIDEKEEVIASALTEVRQDVADIDAKEEVIASALTEVRQNVSTLSGDVENKQDKLQYYSEYTEQWEEEDGENPDSTVVFTQKQSDIHTDDFGDEGSSQAGVQTRVYTKMYNGVLDTGYSESVVNIYANEASNETTEYGSSIEVRDNGVGIKSSFIDYDDESSERLASIDMNNNDVSISLESTANGDSTVMFINPSGVTINDERVLTEGDVDNALNSGSTNPVANSAITQALNAKADASALTAHADNANVHFSGTQKSNYDGLEAQYYVDDSWDIMPMNVFNDFTNDYSMAMGQFDQRISANTNAIAAKQDALSAGTGIEISGNVISATGGGGATYSAGTNISIDTANTINCTLPITFTDGFIQHLQVYYHDNTWSSAAAQGFVVGSRNNITGNSAYIIGDWNEATANSPFIHGHSCKAKGLRNFLSGYYLNGNNSGEAAFGNWNNSVTGSTDADKTLFSVGNGTANNARHNAFEIRQNGDIYVNDGTNDVRLQDTILALGGLKFMQCTQNEYDAMVSGGTVDSSTIYFITNVVS